MAFWTSLGRRWALRVLWELRDGSDPVSGAAGPLRRISSSVLNDRLRELREAGIVDGERTGGYRLTRQGRALFEALAPVDAWAKRWALGPPADPGATPPADRGKTHSAHQVAA